MGIVTINQYEQYVAIVAHHEHATFEYKNLSHSESKRHCMNLKNKSHFSSKRAAAQHFCMTGQDWNELSDWVDDHIEKGSITIIGY